MFSHYTWLSTPFRFVRGARSLTGSFCLELFADFSPYAPQPMVRGESGLVPFPCWDVSTALVKLLTG